LIVTGVQTCALPISVVAEDTRVDVFRTDAPRPCAVKKHRDSVRFIIREVGRPVIVSRAVDRAPEVDRRLPAEVVALVLAPSDVEVSAAAASRTATVEEYQMLVRRQIWDAGVAAHAINDGSQILRGAPRIIAAGALCDPDLIDP